MTGDLLLALDLGTTSTRALVFEQDGTVRGRASRPTETRFPAPGRVEQDPEQLFDASRDALRSALAEARCEARDVAALGIVTQRATALAWDAESGRALCPAIGWQDQRTTERVAELRRLGIPITTQPTATKLEWCLRNEPDVRRAAAAGRLRLGTPDAWLGFRLSGGAAHVTDPGQASCTGLYDLARGAWSDVALELFSLEASALPALVPTTSVQGETPAGLLGAAVPLAARAGDQQSACFAQGAWREGDAKLTLGTSAMLDVNTGARAARAPRGSYALALWRLGSGAQAFCLEGAVVTAGATLDWLVSVGLLSEAEAADAVADSVSGAEGVAFVPALQGLGTPFQDDRARGLLGGLTRGTTAAHVVRAALEGIAHRCVDLCDALRLDDRPLRVDGGLARSDRLVQELADLLGRPVERAVETETTALGAACLAALGAGVFERPEECAALVPAPERFEPRCEAATRDASRRRWSRVVERAREDAEPLDALR